MKDGSKDPDELELSGTSMGAEERELEAAHQALYGRPAAPAVAPAAAPQSTAQSQALEALLNLYSDTPQPAPGQASSVSLGMPVFQQTPQERAAAMAKTDGEVAALKRIPAEQKALLAEKDKQRRGIADAFATKSEANYVSSKELKEKHVRPLEAEAERLAAEHKAAVDARDEYQIRMQSAIQDMDTMGKRIAAEQPRDFWVDAGLPMKIATVVLSALGGASQVANGDRTNAITDTVVNMMQRDTMLQKMRFEKNERDYANQQTLVGRLSTHFDRLEHAQDAAFITGMQGVIGRLNAIKPLLESAQMRQNIDFQTAQLEMRIVDTASRLEADTLGKAVRVGEVATKTAMDQQKAGAAAGQAGVRLGLAQERTALQQDANRRANDTKQQKDDARQIPHWHAVDGKVMADPTEIKALRTLEADTFKAEAALEEVATLLEKGGQFSSYKDWADTTAAVQRAIGKMKGKGLMNAGANFTQLENDLIQKGYLSTDKVWIKNIDPWAAERIRQGIGTLWNDVEMEFAERNYEADDDHPRLQRAEKK